MEEILRKKKEEEDRKRREAEELRQREESIRLKKAAEEKRRRDEEDKRMQQEKEEEQQRQKELKEKEVEAKRRLHSQESQEKIEVSEVKQETALEGSTESDKSSIQIVNSEKKAEVERTVSTPGHVEIRIQARNEAKGSGLYNRNFKSQLESSSNLTETSRHTKESSELVRVQNRLLQKNREHIEPADIFQQLNEANGQEKFSMSNRWKDVKIGLVKDRASSYLKPDENQNFGYQQSPRMKRKILNPASWFRQTTPTPPPSQQVEIFHNAINLQKHGAIEEAGVAEKKKLITENVDEKENMVACATEKAILGKWVPDIQDEQSHVSDSEPSCPPVGAHGVSLSDSVIKSPDACPPKAEENSALIFSANKNADQSQFSQETVVNHSSFSGSHSCSTSQIKVENNIVNTSKLQQESGQKGDRVKEDIKEDHQAPNISHVAEQQPAVSATSAPASGRSETAPWRRLEGSRSRSDLKSPSLNLMLVSITPCSSAKDLSPSKQAAAADSGPLVVSDQRKTAVETEFPSAGVFSETRDKKAAVEKLDETMKELQLHVESLGM